MTHLIPAAAVPLALFSGAALSHPGHDAASGFAAGFAHPFLGADHLLAMLAAGLWAAQLGGRARVAVPAAFVLAMLAGGGLGFAGLSLPAVEPFIASSVLALGLLVATGARLPVATGMLIVAAFAVFHGLAHAVELPAGASAAAYAPGFVLATVLLHGAGLALGRLAPGAFAPALRARLAGVPIALAGAWLLAQPVLS